MTLIVGLLGPAGSGKSTIAEYLVDKYGAKRYSLAAPLKEIAKYTLDFTDEQLYGSQASKEVEDPRYHFSCRWFLQRLGTEGMRRVFGPDVWVRECLRRIASDADAVSLGGFEEHEKPNPNGYLAVVDDVRFKNEADGIRWYDSRTYVWLLESPWRQSNADASHQSEAEWSKAPYDHLIASSAPGLEELYGLVDEACAKFGIKPIESDL